MATNTENAKHTGNNKSAETKSAEVKARDAEKLPSEAKVNAWQLLPAAPSDATVPACARPHYCAPTRDLARIIVAKADAPVTGLRPKRWYNYSVGMSLWQCKVSMNRDHLDVLFYEDHGLMTLRNATDDEFKAMLDQWHAMPQSKIG